MGVFEAKKKTKTKNKKTKIQNDAILSKYKGFLLPEDQLILQNEKKIS